MLENHYVGLIERELQAHNRWYVNIHGSMFSRSGTPDIFTMDTDGTLVGVEVKRPGGELAINQLNHGIEILKSGGRFIVACEGFTIDGLDYHDFCEYVLLGKDAFDIIDSVNNVLHEESKTIEVVL